MKIHDIISEGKTTDRRPSHDAVSKGATRARDVGGYDRVYHMNRVGMAMAMANGHDTKAVDSPQDTWFEKYNTYHPYTQEEANKVKAAINTIPSDTKEVSKFGKSEEPDFVNKTSPVAKPKKNKYGV